ncbi:MAG: AAA family ATPase [Candidatus Omnitrophota bacterium]|nr:AAA family ATPase [Candidatus Omnitrophota bacterium]
MYKDYWGFKEKPFENTPDPRFLYYSSKHKEALMRLLYAVREKKGAAMLSGEFGSGKTLLSRVLMAKLLNEDDHYKVALILNPAIPKKDLLAEIVYQFGEEITKEDRKFTLLHKLNDILYRNMSDKKHSVIIIDEAQAIKDESTFEEIRLLLNFQLNEMFLFTLLLVGQPELKDKIDKIPQLKQRLAIKYHLGTLDLMETGEYIRYRCRVAGRKEPLFSDKAVEIVYDASGGIPREINNICDLCLVIGLGNKANFIDEAIAFQVIRDMKPEAGLTHNLDGGKQNG